MERKEKLLVLKLHSLLKHVVYWKCKVSILGVVVISYFMNQNSTHSKNEQIYIIGDWSFVLDLCNLMSPLTTKRKCVKFVTFYNIFAHCCPMINFEGFKALFQMQKLRMLEGNIRQILKVRA